MNTLTEPGEKPYLSIFAPATRPERAANFEAYWSFSLRHDGEILHDEKNLVKKRDTLAGFQAHPVRSRRPLADPASFYRNHVTMQDDPRLLDRKTLLLTFLSWRSRGRDAVPLCGRPGCGAGARSAGARTGRGVSRARWGEEAIRTATVTWDPVLLLFLDESVGP